MTLSRWRRIATGIAAGVIVLCAALIGSSFGDSGSTVSVAEDTRVPAAIPIPEDDEADEVANADDSSAEPDEAEASDTEASDADNAVRVIEEDELPPKDPVEGQDGSDSTTGSATGEAEEDVPSESPQESAAEEAADDEPEDSAAEATGEAEDGAAADTNEPDSGTSDSSTAEETPAAAPEPAAPLTATDGSLGTGGGVDDVECALDRLVIYAGARRGGVAGALRGALAQAGFGAGCAAPVTVLASNCPQQFAGVLGAGSGYDPNKSFVAASANVDRATMTAVMGQVGYTGSAIDILNFGFLNPDAPGEQWVAIFIPPSFAGWEDLASRAGVGATSQSLCAPSGELAG